MRRVAVVDDHRVVADLLGLVISNEPDLELVGRASSVEECLARESSWDADVIVMDVRLGDGDGIALTSVLTERSPHVSVIVLSAHVDAELMHRAMDAQACVLLPKDGDLDAVLHAVRTVDPAGRGQLHVHSSLLQHLVAPAPVRDGHDLLTSREQEVLRLLATGMDVRQISHEIAVTVNTCRGHVKSILAKLGAHSQLEAVAKAMRRGLIDAAVE